MKIAFLDFIIIERVLAYLWQLIFAVLHAPREIQKDDVYDILM